MSKIEICRGVNRQYQGMVRERGAQEWTLAGPLRKSQKRATEDTMRAFLANYKINRGRVILTADYYDPLVCVKVTR